MRNGQNTLQKLTDRILLRNEETFLDWGIHYLDASKKSRKEHWNINLI